MSRHISRLTARVMLLGALLTLAIAGPTSAFTILRDTGPNGTYYVVDYDTSPGAQCGYGRENGAGQAYVDWIWFLKPEVYARNKTAGRDQQRVKLTYSVQHRRAGSMTRWKTVGTFSQTKTAWDDTRADFRSKRVYASETSTQVWRGVVNLKWMRDGAVEGEVTYTIDWYAVSWTVGANDYVFNPWCDGRAD